MSKKKRSFEKEEDATKRQVKVLSSSFQTTVGCQIHKSEENFLTIHHLLPSGVLEFSVFIPPTVGGSDTLQIKYDWPLAMTNGVNLYSNKISDGILSEDSPVVIAYNRELNTAGYKADVTDTLQCTIVLQLPEKVDSNSQKQELIVAENDVSGFKLYTFVAVIQLTMANKRFVTTEKSYSVGSALERFTSRKNKKFV